MVVERAQVLSGRAVPQSQSLVNARRNNRLAIGQPGDIGGPIEVFVALYLATATVITGLYFGIPPTPGSKAPVADRRL